MKKLLLILILLGLGAFSILTLKAISSQKCALQVQEALTISQEKNTQAYEAGAWTTSEGGQFITSDGVYIPVHSFYMNEDGTAKMNLNLPDTEEILTVKKGDTFEVNGRLYSVYDIYAYSEVDESCQITGPDGGITILEL